METEAPLPTVTELERDLIVRALERFTYVDPAARAIGVSRRTLYRRLKTLGLRAPCRRGRPARRSA